MHPAWTRCPCCENFWCNIHQMHAHDCPCPPIEEWPMSPYDDPRENEAADLAAEDAEEWQAREESR